MLNILNYININIKITNSLNAKRTLCEVSSHERNIANLRVEQNK